MPPKKTTIKPKQTKSKVLVATHVESITVQNDAKIPKSKNNTSSNKNAVVELNSSDKQLLTTLKSKTTKAYNRFKNTHKILKIYAGKTEQDVLYRFKQHTTEKNKDAFKHLEAQELVRFEELQKYGHNKGQELINELEKHLIKKANNDKKVLQFEVLNQSAGGEGGHHDKGDIQKLYLIINKNN